MQYRQLSDLKKLPNNPRIIKDDSFKKLCTSITTLKEYFEARPIILSDRTGELVIIAGNQRYEAAKHCGLTEVPTHLLSGLTEAKEREIIIRDNVANGEWDWSELANAWDDVELQEWGVKLPEFTMGESFDKENKEEFDEKGIIFPIVVSANHEEYEMWKAIKEHCGVKNDNKTIREIYNILAKG